MGCITEMVFQIFLDLISVLFLEDQGKMSALLQKSFGEFSVCSHTYITLLHSQDDGNPLQSLDLEFRIAFNAFLRSDLNEDLLENTSKIKNLPTERNVALHT